MAGAQKIVRIRCRGAEISLFFVDVVIRRWENLTRKNAVLRGAGGTFGELAKSRAVEDAVGRREAPHESDQPGAPFDLPDDVS
jgi:hypothetical protein